VPNGITWDAANQRFIVVLGANSVLAWKPGETTVTKLWTGPGQFDGVEFTKDGALLVSSWADSSVHRYVNGQASNLIKGAKPRRHRL
jgi:sugar lactone lactonase YvrE